MRASHHIERRTSTRPVWEDSAAIDELCSELLRSLPRVDQRIKGARYVRGLLRTPGRKTMRNIAAELGGNATEQTVHHFISGSTWNWEPVRQALAGHVLRQARPQAWVLRPIAIPKGGRHSVGVGRRFEPTAGQVLDGQHAAGVWAVSERATAPVNWRLHLPKAWVEDRDRRLRASIPDSTCVEPLSGCTVSAFTAVAKPWSLPDLPVVFDAREADAESAIRRLRALGSPVLARIDSDLPIVVTDPALPAHSPHPIPVTAVLASAAHLSRGSVLPGPGRPLRSGRSRITTTRVRVRMPAASGGGDLMLLGIGGPDGRPEQVWLTDLVASPTADLLRLSRFVDRVDRDVASIATPVGIRDYVGRSFGGWHRHATLVSIAHTIRALGTDPVLRKEPASTSRRRP
ncbi:IS701 family transposase [Amycolatopsis sp. NPDC098790]|uniref:IS701 family transposase n=1 Tax=Amycolatopsis sp. NPDC098790 TaxID=3363939 RepID=UPI0037FCAB73